MADKFLLIDGSSLIHRAFFALPPLMTKKGVNTGAVYGLSNMLLKLLTDLQPKYVAVAFDKSRKTFRTRKYEAYKAQRKPTPSELSEQFPLAMELLTKMGLTTLEVEDYEADDIIGTLSAAAPKAVEVVIVTGDKDEFQLIDDNVQVYYTKRGISDIQVYDRAEFAKNYEGLQPLQIIDLKGLMGDTSDNIPGVPGVGPKTALKLIVEYQSVENVLANVEKVAGKSLKEKLTNNKEQALLSKDLATICRQAPVATDLAAYEVKGMSEAAHVLMQELQFRNLWDRFVPVLGADSSAQLAAGTAVDSNMNLFAAAAAPAGPAYGQIMVQTTAAAQDLLTKLEHAGEPVALTYVTSGSLPSLTLEQLTILFDKKLYQLAAPAANCEQVLAWLGNPAAPKAVCEGKELCKALLCQGTKLAGLAEDISLAAYLYEPGESSYELRALADCYLVQHQGGRPRIWRSCCLRCRYYWKSVS